jgi:hydroxyacylglutathione hydrolase
MLFRQFLHHEPVTAASYLLGCVGHSVAAVVDPIAPVDDYRHAADALGVRLGYVIDTHVHADHVSTGRELAAAVGASYVLHASAGAAYAFTGVEDGARLELGNVHLTVLHTPGHTTEHLTLAVVDRTRGDEPWALLTGHTVMVADLGRTELATDAATGARALFASAARLRAFPDHVEIWPGAFAGSVCGRGLSGKPSSTVGFERRWNRAFRIDEEEAFVAYMTERIPPPPPNAAHIRRQNLGLEPVIA